jgi:hypothetical protein
MSIKGPDIPSQKERSFSGPLAANIATIPVRFLGIAPLSATRHHSKPTAPQSMPAGSSFP